MSFMKSQVIFLQTLHKSLVYWRITPLYVLAQIYTLVKRRPLKRKFWTFECWVKILQIPHAIFQRASKFFFKFCIILQCYDAQLLCTFFAQTWYPFNKSNTSKYKFSDLPLLALKFTNFLMSFLKPGVSFLQTLHHSSVSWYITLLYFFI